MELRVLDGVMGDLGGGRSEVAATSGGPDLVGSLVHLRPATAADTPCLVPIRESPEVFRWWRGGSDLAAAIAEDLAESGASPYVICHLDRIVGWIQWSEETEPDYRFASIDIYLDPALHGRGIGSDAIRTLARYLFDARGHHRIEIDPATDNEQAIRCYTRVGFRPIGIRRRAERGNDGTWHDQLLMDLLVDELR
jgi:aminoglycoside 6'-N-acetyltransferase